ncbi:hypothetical protein OBBRIDRAFT_822432 [Obba rivulosa]|uniref:Uncharacterized protein n=1 Tax=Obba rivulosa TaxID=1052685 RepID=A0A8E2J705_9APHY|nr:hypothetical protein OBBRIDRAFT_822432 [Obba rivulosa]
MLCTIVLYITRHWKGIPQQSQVSASIIQMANFTPNTPTMNTTLEAADELSATPSPMSASQELMVSSPEESMPADCGEKSVPSVTTPGDVSVKTECLPEANRTISATEPPQAELSPGFVTSPPNFWRPKGRSNVNTGNSIQKPPPPPPRRF